MNHLRPYAFWWGLASVTALPLGGAVAAPPVPSLTVTPHQVRTQIPGLVPLWDTSWWVTFRATRAEAPLTDLEYTARFADSSDRRQLSGAWELSGGDAATLSGRVDVSCPTRPDYERRVRVRLRVRDAREGTSEWVTAEFPVDADEARAAAPAPEPGAGVDERIGTVEVEAKDEMTIGEVRASLARQAREHGGDATSDLRLVGSRGGRVTFAADVIRHKAAPPPAAASQPPPAGDRVVGEIRFQERR